MGRILPTSSERTVTRSEEPTVLFFDDERADDVVSAVRSETARALFRALLREPMTPSELADELDTSVENVGYHLEKLEGRQLVEACDVVYSEKGREMTVYGVTEEPLVLVFESAENEAQLRAILSSLASAVGPVAILIAAKQSLTDLWALSDWL